MIKLIPVEDETRRKMLCEAYHITYDENTYAYISATEGLKAQCIFKLENYRVSLLAIDFDEGDLLIPELLIRAIGSFAANRSGYLFEIDKEVGQAIDSTLITMHFEKTASGYSGKVPKVLQGNCCHHNN